MRQNSFMTKTLILIMFVVSNVLIANAQNMERYIKLNVFQGRTIDMSLKADMPNTPVKLVSGANQKTITVGSSSTVDVSLDAGADTMMIYGNVSEIYCNGNSFKLQGFDATHNLQLQWINCSFNKISSFQLGANSVLKRLFCFDNPLQTLDISQLSGLERLYCAYTELTNLDLSSSLALQHLGCNGNALTSLDVSACSNLVWLECSNNQLSELDLSNNSNITTVFCNRNNFEANKIDELFCSLPQKTTGDNAKIYPLYNTEDDNYNQVILSTKQNAIDKNWAVYYYDGIVGDLHDTPIPSTIGNYDCATGTSGSQVNMNRYIAMKVLAGQTINLRLATDTDNTPIKIIGGDTLNVMSNASWSDNISYTPTQDTVFVYGNVAKFNCSNNGVNITYLDATNNLLLKTLNCKDNAITNLELGANTTMTELLCYSNQLTSLDLSQNTAIYMLRCKNNQLTTLNVSHNAELVYLDCSFNQLTGLALTECAKLNTLICHSNEFSTDGIDALFCELPLRDEYDGAVVYPLNNASDASYSNVIASTKKTATDKYWGVYYYDDSTGSLSDSDIPQTTGNFNCMAVGLNTDSYIVLKMSEGTSVDLDVYGKYEETPIRLVSGTMDTVIIANNSQWTGFKPYRLDADSIVVYGDMLGFDCNQNTTCQIVSIDASHSADLEVFTCSSNPITTLNISNNAKLRILTCINTLLSDLDLSGCVALTELNCFYNPKMTSLDVSNNLALKELWCYGNKISSLDLTNNAALKTLICYSNSLTSLDISHNANLIELSCGWNNIQTLDVSQNKKLMALYCQGINMSSLNVSNNPLLKVLEFSYNSLSQVDVSNNPDLMIVRLYENDFTTNTLDLFYCSLPDRIGETKAGVVYVLKDRDDADYQMATLANSNNAKNKNWEVQFGDSKTDLPQSTSDYVCTTAIDNISDNRILLYPSPVNDVLNINIDEEHFLVEIYNMSGKKVISVKNQKQINVADLPYGLYSVRIVTENDVKYSNKFIKR